MRETSELLTVKKPLKCFTRPRKRSAVGQRNVLSKCGTAQKRVPDQTGRIVPVAAWRGEFSGKIDFVLRVLLMLRMLQLLETRRIGTVFLCGTLSRT